MLSKDFIKDQKIMINISVEKASDMLINDNNVALIDVRTKEEWKDVGIPKFKQGLFQNQLILLEWRVLPNMKIAGNFIESLKDKVQDFNTKMLFICRSGHRSAEACHAALQVGYKFCYNIKEGFESFVNNQKL